MGVFPDLAVLSRPKDALPDLDETASLDGSAFYVEWVGYGNGHRSWVMKGEVSSVWSLHTGRDPCDTCCPRRMAARLLKPFPALTGMAGHECRNVTFPWAARG